MYIYIYITDDEHIKTEFGYNRLNERCKSCVKCREYRKQRFACLKGEATASEGKLKHCNRCYKNEPLEEFVCPNGKSHNACYSCLDQRYNEREPASAPLFSGRYILDKILDPSSDEDDVWGGKRA